MRFRKNLAIFVLEVIVVVAMFSFAASAIQPSGASITAGTPQTSPSDSAGNNSAYAGNVTMLTISAYSTTQAWQGYFGNVSGAIQLADNNDNVLYNWSLASPSGEVYSSTNSSITWGNIQCLNFTANGTGGSSGESAGGTNLKGTNLTVLESDFGIGSDDADGVNETFTLIGAGTHDAFTTANLQFTEGECRNTRVFDSSGAGVSDNFEEALLYEPATSSVVFASILDNNQAGFNAASHDFEMLVLENGHLTDVTATTYFFFVEIE